MNLREGFDLLATAPEGISRLRELIVSLAIQGKLVAQDSNDEPADDLVRKIRNEKDRLIGERKLKAKKSLLPIKDEDLHFQLPPGWKLVRFGAVILVSEAGWSPSCDNTPRVANKWGVLKVSAVSWGRFLPGENKALPDGLSPKPEYEVVAGDFLISRANTDALVARSVVVEGTEPHLMMSDKIIRLKLSSMVEPQYLNLVNNSAASRHYYSAHASGTSSSMKNVSRDVILNLPVAIPPLSEQTRIVAKVDELMRLCNELEARGRLEADQHARLVTTLFDALAASESPHAFAENWNRVSANFDLLLNRPEAVDALEQAIVQLAVRGLLVPQDSTDEPASTLLEEIRERRNISYGRGKARQISQSGNSNDGISMELPSGWKSVTFPDLCEIGGGATPSKGKAAYWNGAIPWVSPKDMKVDFISDAQDHISELALAETRLPLVPPHSLLIVVRGMILAHSFPVATTKIEVTINQDMKSLTPFKTALLPYLVLVCRGLKYEILALVERSTHGTCKLQSERLFAFRFGLPPLAEQTRIVSRVEELRALCKKLRGRLAERQTCQSHLAKALVEQSSLSEVGSRGGERHMVEAA